MAFSVLLRLKRVLGVAAVAAAMVAVILVMRTLFVAWEVTIYLAHCQSISLSDPELKCRTAASRLLETWRPVGASIDIAALVTAAYLATVLYHHRFGHRPEKGPNLHR